MFKQATSRVPQVAEHMAVMKKTTYLDLADKLVLKAKRTAVAEPPAAATGKRDKADKSDKPDAEKAAEDDEKNIRRRVYDAVNVLRAIGAIHLQT
jgi:ribosomal protein L12E/L44/L45/RPP1/RPP2